MWQAFALSDAGCIRQNNEDYFALADDVNLFLVADGIGGAQAGEIAARLAVETVVEHIRRDGHGAAAAALLAAFHKAHERVSAAALDPNCEGMGCTLVAALCDGPDLHLANVGDSRGYVFVDGICTATTADQTWVNEVGRRVGIPEEELKKHPFRHILTVAVGAHEPFRINSYAFRAAPGMQALLCTDGLHDVVSDTEIAAIMSANQSIEWKCHTLVSAARDAGGPDNITVLIVAVA